MTSSNNLRPWSKAKKKFELMRRLQDLGFTYEESNQLRRIEMTLGRWVEAVCNGEIDRNETTGKPERVSRSYVSGFSTQRHAWPVADREAGALKRLRRIICDRNERERSTDGRRASSAGQIYEYHQTDPRGCSLYLVRADQLPNSTDEEMRKHSGNWPLQDKTTRLQWKLSVYYTRGLAVCA